MIYILNEIKAFDIQVEYVFRTLFKILDLNVSFIDNIPSSMKEDDLLISYGHKDISSSKVLQIRPSYLFSEKYMKLDSMPQLPLMQFRNNPILYTENNGQQPYILIRNNKIITNLDIIQSSFFMLTRYEEVILWDKIIRDSHNRFPVTESIAYKENFLSKPVVNEYIEWLWEWISNFNLGVKRKNWWGEYDFCAGITHDIDKAYNHFWAFDYMMELENRYGFKSSFYFMSGGTSYLDNFYKVSDEGIISVINKLIESGFEVGLHGSYNSYYDFQQLQGEKEELDKYNPDKKYGTRQHYLRFKVPLTWEIQEKAGLLYDTTLTFPSHVGFRAGICMPYKVFDIVQNRELNLYEIPLIIMDGTLATSDYMNLDKEESLFMIKQYIDTVKRYKGLFTLLWHNTSLNFDFWKGWKVVFEGALDYIKYNNGTGKTGKEIIALFESLEVNEL
jgi:hypothetical protein